MQQIAKPLMTTALATHTYTHLHTLTCPPPPPPPPHTQTHTPCSQKTTVYWLKKMNGVTGLLTLPVWETFSRSSGLYFRFLLILFSLHFCKILSTDPVLTLLTLCILTHYTQWYNKNNIARVSNVHTFFKSNTFISNTRLKFAKN